MNVCTEPERGLWGQGRQLDILFGIMNDYSKEGAIMETGFSSYFYLGHNELDQENFVNCALPIIKDLVKEQHTEHPRNVLLVASWYELVDAGTWGGVDPRLHFGLLRSDYREKPAYDDFRTQVASYDF